MVEVRRLTTEEVRSRLAELDAKHPTWRGSYGHQGTDGDWIGFVSNWYEPLADEARTYSTYRFLLGDDK